MIKFFRSWCEELILASFIVAILDMLIPEGSVKKYIKVVSGVFMIFVILNPMLTQIKKVDVQNEIEKMLQTYSSNYDEQIELDNSYEILNTISENLNTKEEENAGKIQR